MTRAMFITRHISNLCGFSFSGEIAPGSLKGGALQPGSLKISNSAGFDRPAAKDINFHGLRHSFATTLLGDGVAPSIVSRLVGHASVASTMARYGHWTQDHLDAARVAATGMYGNVRPRTENGTSVEHALLVKTVVEMHWGNSAPSDLLHRNNSEKMFV